MKLSELEKNQKAIIKKVDCEDDLKQRLFSFGIIKGTEIKANEVSLAKNTMVIEIENTELAIRIEEAKQVEVEVI
jgi:ferrous iron transport protein A